MIRVAVKNFKVKVYFPKNQNPDQDVHLKNRSYPKCHFNLVKMIWIFKLDLLKLRRNWVGKKNKKNPIVHQTKIKFLEQNQWLKQKFKDFQFQKMIHYLIDNLPTNLHHFKMMKNYKVKIFMKIGKNLKLVEIWVLLVMIKWFGVKESSKKPKIKKKNKDNL